MTVLNFPATPALNDTYTENGVTYTWNGNYWQANSGSALDDFYVKIAGDNMTGNLTLGTDKITLTSVNGNIATTGGLSAEGYVNGGVDDFNGHAFFARNNTSGLATIYGQQNGTGQLLKLAGPGGSTKVEIEADGSARFGSSSNCRLEYAVNAGNNSVVNIRAASSTNNAATAFNVLDSSGQSAAAILYNGSASFAGSLAIGGPLAGVDGNLEGTFVSTTGRVYATTNNATLPVFEGFTLGGAATSQVFGSGSASFSGTVDVDRLNAGDLTHATPSITATNNTTGDASVYARNNAGSKAPCYVAAGGDGSAKATINNDGSASFSGGIVSIDSNGQIVTEGDNAYVHVGLSKDANKVPFNIYDTAGGNAALARINGDGSASFSGRVTVDTSSDPSNSYAYVGVTSHPSRAVFQATNTAGGLVFAGYDVTGQTSSIAADGSASFAADVTINGVTVGLGSGSVSTNTAVGVNALYSNTSGLNNNAVGKDALLSNTEGNENTAIGNDTLYTNTTGGSNIALGRQALYLNTEGRSNTALGVSALYNNTTGLNNTAVGRNAGQYIEGSNNTILGAYEGTAADATLNDTVIISAGATERMRINSSGDATFSGTVTADSFVTSGGGSFGGSPTGSVTMFAGATVPDGWLECNGQAAGTALAAVLGQANVPDLRGEFVRGFDNGRGVDAGRNLLTGQGQDYQSHNHGVTQSPHAHGGGMQGGNHDSGGQSGGSGGNTNGANANISINNSGGTETRPRNVALMYIIKT